MPKKSREHRIHMMLSEGELTAIDDWRFAHRVATRSDAIRRLCQIGLAYDSHADGIYPAIAAVTRHLETVTQALDELSSGDGNALPELQKQNRSLIAHFATLAIELLDTGRTHMTMGQSGQFQDALEAVAGLKSLGDLQQEAELRHGEPETKRSVGQ